MHTLVSIKGDAEFIQFRLQGITLQNRLRIDHQGERVQHGTTRVFHGEASYLERFNGIDRQ